VIAEKLSALRAYDSEQQWATMEAMHQALIRKVARQDQRVERFFRLKVLADSLPLGFPHFVSYSIVL
jgi:hypothetical protein